MEEVKATEGNLSDDYEEGEILDEDTQLEDVSSLEEFSCEFETNTSGKCIYENCATDSQTEKKLKHTKHHRKKEHKCKEDSVCRKERKGKHCYARIRKDKQLPVPKSKVLDLAPNLFNDKNVPKRLEITSVVKRNTQKSKQSSPVRVKLDSTRPSNRHEHKDYHEKENRHTNKKHWNSNDKLSKNKKIHHDKHSHSKKRKDHGKSKHSSSTCYIDVDSYYARDYEKNQISSKTSLLKRLVGSGNTGVKTLKDNEASGGICIQSDVVESSRSIEAGSSELRTVTSCDTSVKSDSTVTEPLNSSGEKPSESPKSKITKSPQPQATPKKIEVKWMRSIKEDNDELFLRVEALRSAWVKKFNERKKKGLIQQKKSEYIDDSLVDFVLESDSEENNPIWNVSEPLPVESLEDGCKNGLTDVIFSVSDISGDILKPEDMVIAPQDKSTDEPIICEPALQIVTSTNTIDPSLSDSTVFIASSSTLFPATNSTSNEVLHLNERTPHACLKPLHLSTSRKLSGDMKHHQKDLSRHRHHSHSKTPNDIRIYRNITPRSLRDRRSMSRHISRSDRRSIGKVRKKIKKKIMRESLKTNSLEIDDEKLLREQALLSLKSKVNRLSMSQQVVGGSPKVSSNTSITPHTHVNSSQSKTSSLPSQELLERKLSESESAVARSNDNWMDDLDEDILRAQLLSSLTKQVSAQSTKEPTEVISAVTGVPKIPSNFNPVVSSQNIIKVPIKKQDRRRLKSVNKKVWKNKLINTSVRKVKVDDSKLNLRHYNRVNSFINNEVKGQASSNNQSSIVPAIPQVAKLIISVSDSDSSSDNESSNQLSQEPAVSSSTRAEIEANIDILLSQAKMNTQLEKLVGDGEDHAAPPEEPDGNSVAHEKSQVAADEECKIAQNIVSSPEVNESTQVTDGKSAKNQGMPSCSSSSSSVVSATPQALKHLPPWQQEEYRRLKKKIAEKEKVLLEKELQVIRAKAPLKESSPARQSESEESSGQLDQNQNKPDSTVPECHEELTTPPSISGLLSHDVSSKSPSEGDKAASGLSDQEDRLSTKSSKCQTNYSSDDGSPAGKKNYSSLASCSIMEEINVMNDIVSEFHKGSSEYSDLKTKLARLKKAVRVVESKMALKKKKVLLVKDKIQEKDRAISSRIASVTMTQSPGSEKNKAPSRDMELIKLKYKEVSLRAQFLFHDFTTDISNCDENITKGESQPNGSIVTGLKMKAPDSTVSRKRVVPNESKPAEKLKEAMEPPKKRSFSGKEREREEWDPNTPVCHFDLNGICKDEECKYQHFKTV